jgi:hypothetical protein
MQKPKSKRPAGCSTFCPAVYFCLAQGMFYAEETKDGRIYVFNNPASYQMWKDGAKWELRSLSRSRTQR